MTRVQLTASAEQELGELIDFVLARDGQQRALRVLDGFEAAFQLLAEQPNVGFRRDEWTGPAIRWWRVFDWMMLYQPETSPPTVMRILHGARDLDAMLSDPTTLE